MVNKIKKTVIFTSYGCNNQCVFCIDAEKRQLPSKTTDEIKQVMIEARNRGATYLELIGGEFTIREDAIALVKFARKLGFSEIVMSTNGRIYSYLEFVKRMIDAGLTQIIFSIHGHTPELHDNLTQVPGSFKQLTQGLENFKSLNFANIGSNTTIVKQNYRELPQIGEFIFKQGIRNSEFIFVDPNYGGARLRFYECVPKISKITPYVHKCLDIGKRENLPHWHIRYVPLCYFQDYLDQVSELDEVKKFETEHIAPDFVNLDVESSRQEVGRAKGKQCRLCKLNDKCEGIWKTYAEHYGVDELKPIK